MKVDYEKAYKELRTILTNMDAYCHNCTANGCEECHRKSIGWRFDINSIPSLHNYEIEE